MIYATPVPILQGIIDSRHFTELMLADARGLLPDPWRQTGTIAAEIRNCMSVSDGRRATADDYVPRPAAEVSDFVEQGRAMVKRKAQERRR